MLVHPPPQVTANRERLAGVIKLLHRRPRHYVFEFRHPSWYEDDILDLLREHDMALCLSDHHDAPSPWEITARHVYVRGHGPGGAGGRRRAGRRGLGGLREWRVLGRGRSWRAQG